MTTTKTLLGGETSFRAGAVMEVTYSTTLSAGDHRVQAYNFRICMTQSFLQFAMTRLPARSNAPSAKWTRMT